MNPCIKPTQNGRVLKQAHGPASLQPSLSHTQKRELSATKIPEAQVFEHWGIGGRGKSGDASKPIITGWWFGPPL